MSKAKKEFKPEVKLAAYDLYVWRISDIKRDKEKEIAQIKQKAVKKLAPWLEKEKALKKEIKSYFTKNKKTLFEKIKSIVYTVGTVGFRRTPPKLDIPKDQSALIELIKKKYNNEYIKRYITTTEKLNIEVLEKAGDKILENLGIGWKSKDQFYIDLNKNPATKKVRG